jgi:hypothetical protein
MNMPRSFFFGAVTFNAPSFGNTACEILHAAVFDKLANRITRTFTAAGVTFFALLAALASFTVPSLFAPQSPFTVFAALAFFAVFSLLASQSALAAFAALAVTACFAAFAAFSRGTR